MNIKLKRAYETPQEGDGFRILVDRLWPRGVSRDSAHIDLWLKEIAPSTDLRKEFSHDPAKWTEFHKMYIKELDHHPEAVATLLKHARQGTVTLVYGAKDKEHNNAVVIKEYLKSNRANF
ncbi:MAG: DUF488 domain-containing protein [Smithella sp.]